ncbi:MAG: hypothetical protein WKF79_06425 [Nocardioides sp.]
MRSTRTPWSAGVDVAAPAPVAWDLLVELDMWPRWGPSVRAARLGDGPSGAGRLHGGASGAVQTPARLWLPFTVTDWHEAADGSGVWGWRVAGVPATTHRVLTRGADKCRIEMAVPWWAPGYLAVVVPALRRLRGLAEDAAGVRPSD